MKPALRAPGQHILIILIAKHAARPSSVMSGASVGRLVDAVGTIIFKGFVFLTHLNNNLSRNINLGRTL